MHLVDLREQDGDHVHAEFTRIGNSDSLQCHGVTVPPTETRNLLGEIDRRIRARWMSLKCYTREMSDRP